MRREKHLSKTKANTYCNQHLKKEHPFLKEVDKFALTNAIYHLADGYDRFFKHLSRFPKYKSKHKAKKSYTTNITNGNIEIGDNSIKLPKLGWVRAKIHRRPKENWKLKSATVTQNRDDTYQVSILFAYEESISPAAVKQQPSGWIINQMGYIFPVKEISAVCLTISGSLQTNLQKHSGS
mgnify:FL=1